MTVVWVDADSCPRMVREYLVSYTKKLEIPVICKPYNSTASSL